jgi:hypothetical protein
MSADDKPRGWPLAWDAIRATRGAPLPHGARHVYIMLVVRADANGVAWPAHETIAADAGQSRATVIRMLDVLESQKWITVTRRRHGARQDSSLYQLHIPSEYQRETLTLRLSPSESHGDPVRVSNDAVSEYHHDTGSAHLICPGSAQSLPGRMPGGKATVKAKRQKPEPEQTSDYKQAVACYFEEYEKARGVKPPFDAREGKAVNVLLAKLGNDAERACHAIRNAYADPFWQGKATIRSIADEPGRHDGKQTAQRRNDVQPAPEGRKWKTRTS